MVDVTPLVKSGTQIIQSYNDGGFRVSGTRYEGAVLVHGSQTQAWDVNDFPALKEEDFSNLAENSADIDVVLLGVGARMQFLPKVLKVRLKELGLHVEVMDSAAACRTYNVLIAEERRVVAALLPVL